MLKTNKQIKKAVLVAIFTIFAIPTMVSAGPSGDFGSDSWGGDSWGSWGGYAPTYDYTYTPNYSYDYSPSYSGSSYGGGYTPSYGGGSYGSSYVPYTGSSYGGSSIPSVQYSSNSNSNENNNTSHSNSNSTSSSSAVAVNNNVNNVYVYTNPSGNAVVNNPAHQYLNVYCVITPANPRIGQVVTATAYATGGIGNYTYTWGGDIYAASGASTSFTSYTAGTKTITVTVRSDQEVITKSCSVTFEGNTYYGGGSNYTGSSVNLTPGITSGTPVSGVYLSDLPATGVSLTFTHYMVGAMVMVLALVGTFVFQARKRLMLENA